jgi:hypothetical protein
MQTQLLPHLDNFTGYIDSTYRKCNSVKIIVDRDQVHRLSDIYVKGRYEYAGASVDDDEICQLIRDNGRVVIQGFGGIGKTMLLKYIWLSIVSESAGRIPVMIELRRLNELNQSDLLSYIRAALAPTGRPMSVEQFETLLISGKFVLLFDALDEVNDEIRLSIEKQILDLSHRYTSCGVLVSSRHNPRFGSWDAFRVYHATPFNKKQIIEVIKKVPFESKVKAKFLSELVGRKYESYSDFLETPLLALMMLMTFEQFADVPEKVHIFYRYAFQTLYTLHDAGKEAFRRERKSKLNEDDFCKIFALLCLSTYISRVTSFSRKDLVSDVSIAAGRAQIRVDANDYVSELCESVNLMYDEGDHITFTHRSFQEYFTADALTGHMAANFSKLVGRIPNYRHDSVLMMAYEMKRDLVEEGFLIPFWAEYKEVVAHLVARTTPNVEVLRAFGAQLVIFPMAARDGVPWAMSEFYAESDFSRRVKRALAFLPEGRALEWDDTLMSEQDGDVMRALMVDGLRPAKLSRRSRGVGYAEFDLPTGQVTVYFDEDDEARIDLGDDFLAKLIAKPKIKERLSELCSFYRALLVGLHKDMRGVIARSKNRAETLDDLLS